MFDTHCHLNFDSFDSILEDTVDSARNEGVKQMVVPGIDILSSKKAIKVAENFNGIYASCGIHPTVELKEEGVEKELARLQKVIEKSEKVVAVGEIGLDYYRHKAPARVQKIFFEEQLKLAGRIGLPVIIHNRHSVEDVVRVLTKMLSKYPMLTGVLHSMEADDSLVSFANDSCFLIGIAGDVTYDKKKMDMVRKLLISSW